MNQIKRKLRSRRGASITFALLIFLVCAVVSSVVIVAATTAGGRLSGAKESNQRYFAVTAAADVLRDTLEGESSGATLITYTVGDDGNPDEDSLTVSPNAGLCAIASKWLFGGDAMSAITITPESTIENIDYSCTITPQLANGVLSFNIACTGGQVNSTGAYTLQANFASDIKDSVVDEATHTHRAKVSWQFIGLRKIRATGATGGTVTP